MIRTVCWLCGNPKDIFWLYCEPCAQKILDHLGISMNGLPCFVHLPKVVPATGVPTSPTTPDARKSAAVKIGTDLDDD